MNLFSPKKMQGNDHCMVRVMCWAATSTTCGASTCRKVLWICAPLWMAWWATRSRQTLRRCRSQPGTPTTLAWVRPGVGGGIPGRRVHYVIQSNSTLRFTILAHELLSIWQVFSLPCDKLVLDDFPFPNNWKIRTWLSCILKMSWLKICCFAMAFHQQF